MRKVKNIHYIYKTTCNVTGKWYVGMHSTSNLDDGYMGSGKILRHSIRKYGVENHSKEILEFLPTREELVLREIEIVTKELVGDGKCMNLKEGGTGGCSSIEHKFNFSRGGVESRKLLRETNPDWVKTFSKKASEGNIKAYESGKRERSVSYDWNGKTHSKETKQLMSDKAKERTSEQNSQYGTCWITNGTENKKIKKEDLETYQLDGWLRGRK